VIRMLAPVTGNPNESRTVPVMEDRRESATAVESWATAASGVAAVPSNMTSRNLLTSAPYTGPTVRFLGHFFLAS
jgi:hypothetical protein